MKQGNVVLDKSYHFSLRVVKLYIYLREKKREFNLSAQVLRSGTSIGANIEEATGGLTRREFRSKMSIAYKEAKETRYWLRLLNDSAFLDKKLCESFIKDCEELIKLLTAILNTLKSN